MSPRPSRGALSAPAFHILLALHGRELHGYAVILEIERRTDGELRLTASTLYAALKRMLHDGWIEELEGAPEGVEESDPRRRYYRLTGLGRSVLQREARRLERAVELARERHVLAPAPPEPVGGEG